MSDHELWQVKISEGCVLDMTLDEIDTAFNAGRIQASTLVMPPNDMRWTTLGAAAGLEDEREEAPYSIAPIATDIAPPSSYGYSAPTPEFEVDLASIAANGDAYGLPKKRNVAGTIALVLAFFVLISAGIGGGAYAARPNDVKAKIASIKAKVAKTDQRAAAVAPPAAAPLPPPAAKPEPAPVAVAPAATPAQPAVETPRSAPPLSSIETPPLSSIATSSVDSLPDAKGTKKGAAPKSFKKKK